MADLAATQKDMPEATPNFTYIPPAVNAKIQRTRDAEKARRERIFNAKVRTIGVDKEALDAGVVAIQAQKAAAKAENDAFDAQNAAVTAQMKLLELERQRLYKESTKDVVAFNLTEQPKEGRREWDLCDPKALLKEAPTRMGDVDPRLGVSSIQVFAGEDINRKQRIAEQHAQQRAWLDAQMAGNSGLGDAEKAANMAEAANEKAICELRGELEAEEQRLRRELTIDQLDANKEAREAQMASHLVFGYKRKTAEELAEERAEMEFHTTDGFLNNNTPHINANGKIRRDHYRGSSAEELRANAAAVVAQREADESTAAAAKEAESTNDKQYEQTRRVMVGMELQRNQMYKETVKQQLAENEALSAAKAAREAAAAAEKSAGGIDDHFFKFFGTTTR